MKREKLLLVALGLILFATSCQPRLYFPDRANVLGFKERGEAKLTASFKPQFDNDGSADVIFPNVSPAFDAGVSITDHFAITGSYRSMINRTINENDIFASSSQYGRYNGHRFEGGVGYFTGRGKALFEVLGGYGGGVLHRNDLSNVPATSSYDFDTRYHRFYIQAAGGIGGNVVRFMGGIKIAAQKYYDFTSPNPTLISTIASNDGIYGGATDQLFIFVEPFANMEVGYKLVKFNMQIGTAGQVSGGKIGADIPFYMSLGITLHYAPRFFGKG